jgi:hypothetical protein
VLSPEPARIAATESAMAAGTRLSRAAARRSGAVEASSLILTLSVQVQPLPRMLPFY